MGLAKSTSDDVYNITFDNNVIDDSIASDLILVQTRGGMARDYSFAGNQRRIPKFRLHCFAS